jgi:serine protein kinase
MSNILNDFAAAYDQSQREQYSLLEYLDLCREDKSMYATAAERMLKAIGEPKLVDTSKDPRLARIHENRTIKVYPAFEDAFFGIEESIERVVSFFRAAAQGLEERKQILYLLGPVGSSKSSMAERLKMLMEKFPIYVLAFNNNGKQEISPVFESPLGLFEVNKYGKTFEKEYKIDPRYLNSIPSPWALKRLALVNGDLSKFSVVRMYPSKLNQQGIMKVEPGDENNQDISSLVGKVNLRRIDAHDQNDSDAYLYSGGLCRANQGMLEFVEMFKAPIKVLHPLLTATQEGNYVGTEALPPIPFNGVVVSHSNESEWEAFKGNKNNEAFLDRVSIVTFPYCKRIDEEIKIYEKMLGSSSLQQAPIAPQTLKYLAQWSVQTRLKTPDNGNLFSKARVYNGENLKDLDPRAKSVREYRDVAGVTEGMTGMSTRFAFKILSKTFNLDVEEVAADPLQLMVVLNSEIEREQMPKETETFYKDLVKEISQRYLEDLTKDIQKAFIEDSEEYCQNMFERYISLADSWVADNSFKDDTTGTTMTRQEIDAELSKIEKPAGISNPKDFRPEVVNFVLRVQAKDHGKMPRWNSYEKIKQVIEAKMSSSLDELLPVISFDTKKESKIQKDHDSFVDRMVKLGYTPRQVRRVVEWFGRAKKSN